MPDIEEKAGRQLRHSHPKRDGGLREYIEKEDKSGPGVMVKCKDGVNEAVIPDGVTRINRDMFAGCPNLSSVTIPVSVKEIGWRAFAGCGSLSEISYGGTMVQWNAVKKNRDWHHGVFGIALECADGVLELPVFDIENGVLISYNAPDTSVVIPDGVTKIGERVFHRSKLASVVIPDSVTEIGFSAFSCTGLKSLELPPGVRKIASFAFARCPLTAVEIPEGVEEIGDNAFYWCNLLTSISFPASVKKIGSYLFGALDSDECCVSLSKISYGGTKAQWVAVAKGERWHDGVPATGVQCIDGMAE